MSLGDVILPVIVQIDAWQRRKRNCLLLILVAASLFVTGFSLRFLPAMNDVISGEPEYMRWIADRFAHSIASQYGVDAAVIAIKDEKTDCRQISDLTVPNPDDLYYVVSYSETARTVCFLTYARLPDSWNQANSFILYPKAGRNYGRGLDEPVKLVPVAHLQMIFPTAYLSLLHWRARIDRSSFARAADSKIERWFTDSPQPVGSVDVSIDFPALRADVGSRHDFVNRALTVALFTCILAVSFGAFRVWTLYRSFRSFLAPYLGQVDLSTFLSHDLRMIGSQAREGHQQEQKRALEQARAATLFNRSKEAIRGRLESVFNALPDDERRLRVQDCLSRAHVDEMKALLQELQGQAGQKTPEDKLTALLDTLKAYCTNEEFDRCCTEAFQMLTTTGFREARSFVVEAHDQLRARSKELEKQEAALAGSLLDSLDATVDERAEKAGDQEIAQRIADLDSGKARTIPWEEVRGRISSRLTRCK